MCPENDRANCRANQRASNNKKSPERLCSSVPATTNGKRSPGRQAAGRFRPGRQYADRGGANYGSCRTPTASYTSHEPETVVIATEFCPALSCPAGSVTFVVDGTMPAPTFG